MSDNELNQRVVASDSVLDTAMRAIQKLATKVNELLGIQKITREQLAVKAAMFLEIKDSDSEKNSPEIDLTKADRVTVVGMEKLRKNYGVLREMFETKNEIEAMEARLRVTFARSKSDPSRALRELETLKASVTSGIKDSLNFLHELAKKHLPRTLDNFVRGVSLSVQKSLVYDSASLHSYVFESEGNVAFTVYLRLKDLSDESGKHFPEVYLTMTYITGNSPQMYVGIQHHFAPPSDDLKLKKVKNIKEALSAFSMLLDLDDIDNSLGSLPMNVLLNPSSITKDIFTYRDQIRGIEVEEDKISFVLKPSALSQLDVITAQLFKELDALRRRTNAKLRMSTSKNGKTPTISFRFVTANGAPPVDASDLSFLKDRFSLDDSTISKVVRQINLGS